jgi:hypothetical protein
VTAPKPTNQRRLMTGVYISPIRTPDERCVYLPFSHGLVASGSIASRMRRAACAALVRKRLKHLFSCQDRNRCLTGPYDQSTGCRFWKYLKTVKQAKATERCLSVCPLRIKFEWTT